MVNEIRQIVQTRGHIAFEPSSAKKNLNFININDHIHTLDFIEMARINKIILFIRLLTTENRSQIYWSHSLITIIVLSFGEVRQEAFRFIVHCFKKAHKCISALPYIAFINLFYLWQELIVGPRIKRNDALREQRMRLDKSAYPFIASLTENIIYRDTIIMIALDNAYRLLRIVVLHRIAVVNLLFYCGRIKRHQNVQNTLNHRRFSSAIFSNQNC